MATRVDRLHVLLRRWPVTGTVCGCVFAELRGEPTVRRGLTHRWHRLNETPEQDETMAQLKPWNSLVRASPWQTQANHARSRSLYTPSVVCAHAQRGQYLQLPEARRSGGARRCRRSRS